MNRIIHIKTLKKSLRRQVFIFGAALFLFALVLNPPTRAATEEDQVKAVFLYNLVNFVNWPENALNDCDSFIITVVGQSRFADLVSEAVKNEFKADLKIEVQYMKELNKVQYNNCCGMIFIDQKYQESWQKHKDNFVDKPILIVGESRNFIEQGGMVNLLTKGNRIQIEIGIQQSKNVGISYSAKLLRLARLLNQQ